MTEEPTNEQQAEEKPNNGQLSRADLKTMRREDVQQAVAEGRVNALLGRPLPAPKEGQLTRADLRNMSRQEVMAAKAAGRLDTLLNRTN